MTTTPAEALATLLAHTATHPLPATPYDPAEEWAQGQAEARKWDREHGRVADDDVNDRADREARF